MEGINKSISPQTKFSIILLIWLILSILFVISCGTARKDEPLAKPVNVTNQQVFRGEIAYKRFCNKCHPNGEAGLGPALANKKILPKFLIKFQVRNGLGAMPSFSEKIIPPDILDDIVEYIIALRNNA